MTRPMDAPPIQYVKTTDGFFFYSLPLIIAILRDSRHQAGIMVLDVLLGWTVVGWLISFIWAFHDK